MRSIESYFEALEMEQLEQAFEEYQRWRETGILADGVLRDTWNKFVSENDFYAGIHTVGEPLLYVLVTRMREPIE